MREFEIYIDGASKGNPGPSGIGVVICRDKETVKNISSFIGIATNNIAEYTALLYGLREALNLKAEAIEIKTDSQLLARQLNKVYKVKHPNIVGLYNQALNLLAAFKEVSIKNIPREENIGADKLATQAIKKELKKPAYR
ncbi:MAG: ribonuclease HI family protein [Candidatus Omnitrophica bacterium]|nr:ribonuclease HI family protein [Candidatus Omnitrophota bacterium]